MYKDTFVLFHEQLGGHRFGGVWDPSLKTPRPFRVLGGFSSIPTTQVIDISYAFVISSPDPPQDAEKHKDKDKSLVVLNENAVLSEIERMGRSMVRRIVVQV